MPHPFSGRLARGAVRDADGDGGSRLRAGFAAHYSGSWPTDDAFDWSLDADADSAAGSPSPRRALRELRDQLYRPGASDEQVRRFAERSAEIERELALARAALLRAQHRRTDAHPMVAVRRRRVLLLALTGVVAASAVGAAVLTTAAPPAAPAASHPLPNVHRLTAVPLRLRGTAAQIAALRTAIHGDSEGPDALVTATAIRDVPALRSASALSESDLTATGHGTITIPDLDEFSPQRHATVLVFCDRATSYDWTMTAYRGAANSDVLASAAGHGADCSGLTYITVPLPGSVHRFSVSTRVGGSVRFLMMLQSTP